jgi:protein gp37
MHPNIPRKLRDDCVVAGVPFFFKSWGEWYAKANFSLEQWAYQNSVRNKPPWGTLDINGNWFPSTTPWNGHQGSDSDTQEYIMSRIGKKAAGRLLDGRTWEGIPHGL